MPTKEKRILLIDNNMGFLNPITQLLRRAGYIVTPENSLTKAAFLLKHAWFHIAIIDWRMDEYEGPDDDSGYRLAKEAPHQVPKIIQTVYNEYMYPYRIITDNDWDRRLNATRYNIVDYVLKEDGPEHLLKRVERAFDRLSLPWQLQINENAQNLGHLVKLIGLELIDSPEFSLSREQLQNYHELEIDDLLRMLFRDMDSLHLLYHEWISDQRIGLQVEASNRKESTTTLYWVTVGPHEKSRVEKMKSGDQGISRRFFNRATTWSRYEETSHYGANRYEFSGLQPNTRLFSLKKPKDLQENELLEKCLGSLREDKFPRWQPHTYRFGDVPATRMMHELAFGTQSSLELLLDEKIQAITESLAGYGHRIERKDGKMVAHLAGQPPFVWVDPLQSSYLSKASRIIPRITTAPGPLQLGNILADSMANVWLTDFLQGGDVPLSWIPASVEAIARYDLAEGLSLVERIQLEEHLLPDGKSQPLGKLPGDESELSQWLTSFDFNFHLPLRQVWRTRAWAAHVYNSQEYHLALFYQAARRLGAYAVDEQDYYSAAEQNRFAHLIISLAMIADHYAQPEDDDRTGLWWNHELKAWYYAQNRLQFGEVPERVLTKLYEQCGKTVSQLQLANEISENSAKNTILDWEISNLQQVISRIRKALHDASGTPGTHWIWTIRNKGYSLRIPPEPMKGISRIELDG